MNSGSARLWTILLLLTIPAVALILTGPRLFAVIGPYAILLACPLSMGVMMWLMGRGMNAHGMRGTMELSHESGAQPPVSSAEQVTLLQAQLSTLQQQQQDMLRQLAALTNVDNANQTLSVPPHEHTLSSTLPTEL